MFVAFLSCDSSVRPIGARSILGFFPQGCTLGFHRWPRWGHSRRLPQGMPALIAAAGLSLRGTCRRSYLSGKRGRWRSFTNLPPVGQSGESPFTYKSDWSLLPPKPTGRSTVLFGGETWTMSNTANKKKHRSSFSGGLEGMLDGIGVVVLLVGFISGVLHLDMFRFLGALSALNVWLGALVIWAVLRSLGELIRLQKKRLNLPYDGCISEAKEMVIYACSECGAVLYSDTRCERCGRSIASSPEAEHAVPPNA